SDSSGKIQGLATFFRSSYTRLESSWKTRDGIVVQKLKDVFLFHCFNKEDIMNLLSKNTLNFQGALLILKVIDQDTALAEVNFKYSAIWVRAEGILVRYFAKNIIKKAFRNWSCILAFDKEADFEYKPHSFQGVTLKILKESSSG
ncbi:Inositol 1 4 5-trisphosphate receptor type 1, partial [Bienertia sinuspersici]